MEFQLIAQHGSDFDQDEPGLFTNWAIGRTEDEYGLAICTGGFDWRGRNVGSETPAPAPAERPAPDGSTAIEPTQNIHASNGFASKALFFSEQARRQLLAQASAEFWIPPDNVIALQMGAHGRLGATSPIRLLPASVRQMIVHFAAIPPQMPLLLESALFRSPRLVECGHNSSPVVGHATFVENFDCYTGGAFRCFTEGDWANLVVAGGAVLAALTPDVSNDAETWPNSDIDLFLYGLTDDAARAKIDVIFQRIVEAEHTTEGTSRTSSVRVLRTMHTLTFIREVYRGECIAQNAGWNLNHMCRDGSGDVPIVQTMAESLIGGRARAEIQRRNIQVILRLHSSPAEVISAFDVDCCALMFDGERVIATDRAIQALVTRVNLAVPSRRSKTYGT